MGLLSWVDSIQFLFNLMMSTSIYEHIQFVGLTTPFKGLVFGRSNLSFTILDKDLVVQQCLCSLLLSPQIKP